MSLLDKLGKVTMDALDRASRAAEEVQKRVDPIIDKNETAARLRDRLVKPKRSLAEIPDPESNDSPFVTEAAEEPEIEEAPLADPDKAAQIFGRGTDPWTGRALELLADRDVEHDFVDLEAEGGLKIETRLMRETGQQTSPYVFLRGELIGGFDALNEIERLGQLDQMILPPEERRKGGMRIVIPKRSGDAGRAGERSPDDRK
ncbi:MAG: glutaredoxin [Polyangiaceae bacterium]